MTTTKGREGGEGLSQQRGKTHRLPPILLLLLFNFFCINTQ